MPASVAIGTLVSMLSRQSLQHKTKAWHTRRRNNQRTFWMTFNPSRKEGSWEVVKILTNSHDKFNDNSGNTQHSIRSRAKSPQPPRIQVVLNDELYYCGICLTKRHVRKVLNQWLFIFKAFDGWQLNFRALDGWHLLERYISMS